MNFFKSSKMKFIFIFCLIIGVAMLTWLFNKPTNHEEQEAKHSSVTDEHKKSSHEENDEHEEGEHEEHGEGHEENRITPDKAVTHANEKEGIQLSEEAMQTIGVKLQSISVQNSSEYIVPSSSLVYSADLIGVYRYRKNHFKMIQVKLVSKDQQEATISTNELTSEDQIAIAGVPLLRTADMDAFGGEASHGH